MKKIILNSIFLLSCYLLSAQNNDLTCLDFTKGEFKNFDANNRLSSTIIRKGEKQLEITDNEYNFKKIRWLNDCDYILYFNHKDAKKDHIKSYINKNGGVTIKVKKIEGNTLYYTTSFYDGKKENTADGKMIKISSDASFK